MFYKTTSYERVAQKLLLGQPRAKPIAKFLYGRLRLGLKSLHLTKQSRTWRLFWRLKHKRKGKDYV